MSWLRNKMKEWDWVELRKQSCHQLTCSWSEHHSSQGKSPHCDSSGDNFINTVVWLMEDYFTSLKSQLLNQRTLYLKIGWKHLYRRWKGLKSKYIWKIIVKRNTPCRAVKMRVLIWTLRQLPFLRVNITRFLFPHPKSSANSNFEQKRKGLWKSDQQFQNWLKFMKMKIMKT